MQFLRKDVLNAVRFRFIIQVCMGIIVLIADIIGGKMLSKLEVAKLIRDADYDCRKAKEAYCSICPFIDKVSKTRRCVILTDDGCDKDKVDEYIKQEKKQ